MLVSCVFPVVTSKVDPEPFLASEIAFIKPSATSRDDIVQHLGDPTLSRREGRLLVYAVSVNPDRVVFVSVGEFAYDHHYLFVDFDQDQVVQSYEDMVAKVRRHLAGETVALEVSRDRKSVTAEVTFARHPESEEDRPREDQIGRAHV